MKSRRYVWPAHAKELGAVEQKADGLAKLSAVAHAPLRHLAAPAQHALYEVTAGQWHKLAKQSLFEAIGVVYGRAYAAPSTLADQFLQPD